jgi:hypothetical protein
MMKRKKCPFTWIKVPIRRKKQVNDKASPSFFLATYVSNELKISSRLSFPEKDKTEAVIRKA